MEGKIFDIKRFALNDGPGIRTTIFLKGCPLKCIWCHNPEGISFDIDEYEEERVLDGLRFTSKQSVGKMVSVDMLMKEIKKDQQFFIQSGGGVTFSGGEPLAQYDFLFQMVQLCKQNDLHITIDTSGLCSINQISKIAELTDLFLFDIKFVDDDLHLKYTGVSNKLILQNLEYILKSKTNVIIRIPVIPGINDSNKCIAELKLYLDNLKNDIKELHFLPFHNSGISKYNRFNKEYEMRNAKSQQSTDLLSLKEEFTLLGITTKIGGL